MDAVVRLPLLAAVLCAVLSATLGQDQQQQCQIFGGPACETEQASTTQSPDQGQYCSIFGGPSCNTEAPVPGLYNECTCPDATQKGCECVYFYQCDNTTGVYNSDGKGLLDVRKKDGCPSVELRCCKIDIPKDKREKPEPHETFQTPRPPSKPGACGVRNPGGLSTVIINNNEGEAGFGEFPWMAALLVKHPHRPGDEYKCGGAILNSVVVLTAAHCVRGIAKNRLKVRAGEWDRETESELYKHQDRGVSDYLSHKEYYAGNNQYDVALLILDSPLHLGLHIGTVCLAEPGDGSAFDYKRCLVAGWGKETVSDVWPHRYLKRIELPVVPRAQCESSLQNTGLGAEYSVHESFLCAGGEEGKDTCTGDGGSPLVCQNDAGHYEAVGLVSWGVECGLAGLPALYTNLPVVREWIDRTLTEKGITERIKNKVA